MSHTRALASLCALTLLPATPHAFVLIEDFTVAEHHAVIDWPKNSYAVEQNGLDTAHSVFGRRTMDLTVQNNFDHVPIHLDLAGGVQRVSYSSHNMATTLYTGFGFNGNLTVDFSAEDRFYVDVFTENPEHRFADQWSIDVIDAAGKDTGNSFALSHEGGIYFMKKDFPGVIDWSHIRYMRFTQEFSFGSGSIPMAYGATKIYSVPDPTILLAFPLLFFGLPLRAKARNGR